jgi:hypothetical protein
MVLTIILLFLLFCLQETVQTIVFRLLNQVVVADMLDSTLTSKVFPYMKEKGLPQDETLLAYVQDLIERSGHISASIEEAPWESHAIDIVHRIRSHEVRA